MQRTHRWSSIAIAAALAGAAPFALAQTNPASESQHPQSGAVTHTPPFQTPPPQNQNANPNQNQTSMPPGTTQPNRVMGRHDMTGTVESVSQDGIVEVRTAEGILKVHFPDAAGNLKKGEKITLHLAYTVDTSPPSSAM